MPNVGKVVQIMGPVVDVRFATNSLPEVNNAIIVGDPAKGASILA